MALTKSVAAVDEWAEVAQNGVREGATVDVSGCYAAELMIACALSSTTAQANGAEVRVQLSGNTSGDEDWFDYMFFVGPTGTAISVALAGTEAAGQTVLSVTNPVTNNLDNEGKWLFIENTTVANSELVFVISNSGDAGDTITIADGLTNEQTTSSNIFDIDSATAEAVRTWVVPLPAGANRVRVVYNNTRDAAGSTVHTYCRITKVTAL